MADGRYNRHLFLPDDGEIDQIAVEIASTGRRVVPMTRPEALEAAMLIMLHGGTPTDICNRIGVGERTGQHWYVESRKLAKANGVPVPQHKNRWDSV